MSKNSKDAGDREVVFMAALARIAGDPAARRELLWVRAMERGDAATVEALQSVDPGVGNRLEMLALCILECALAPAALDDPGVRRELYLRVHDERFRHHYALATQEPCACIECAGISFAEQPAGDRARGGAGRPD